MRIEIMETLLDHPTNPFADAFADSIQVVSETKRDPI
jgi:hypothetical protein